MSGSNDLEQWYRSIPKISRVWFTAAIVVPLATKLSLVSSSQLLLWRNPLIKQFQIWRLVTGALVYLPKLDFGYLIMLYFLYQYSTRLEKSTYNGKPGDYVFCLTFLLICNDILHLMFYGHRLMISTIMSVMYIWCQLNKETRMSLWFGMEFKAMYMPWVIAIFQWILKEDLASYLCGIIVGHLYVFLVFKYPQDFGGRQLLKTPRFLYRFFPNEHTNSSGFGAAPIRRRVDGTDVDDNTNRRNQVFGGRGHVLGDR